MSFKKLFLLINITLIAPNAFAVENNSSSSNFNLDILTGIGYTQYNEQSTDNSPYSDVVLRGGNLNVSALYSILNTSKVSPVVGGGLNLTYVSGSENVGSLGTKEVDMSSISLIANGGFKFIPSSAFSIYTLANFGYALSNNHTTEITTPYNSYNVDSKIKNHYYYGANLIGTYEILKNFNIGAGFIYNRHTMSIESATLANSETVSSGIDPSFNEYSANIMVVFNF
jgi:hypothetical protein